MLILSSLVNKGTLSIIWKGREIPLQYFLTSPYFYKFHYEIAKKLMELAGFENDEHPQIFTMHKKRDNLYLIKTCESTSLRLNYNPYFGKMPYKDKPNYSILQIGTIKKIEKENEICNLIKNLVTQQKLKAEMDAEPITKSSEIKVYGKLDGKKIKLDADALVYPILDNSQIEKKSDLYKYANNIMSLKSVILTDFHLFSLKACLSPYASKKQALDGLQNTINFFHFLLERNFSNTQIKMDLFDKIKEIKNVILEIKYKDLHNHFMKIGNPALEAIQMKTEFINEQIQKYPVADLHLIIIACIKVFYNGEIDTNRAKMHCPNFYNLTENPNDAFHILLRFTYSDTSCKNKSNSAKPDINELKIEEFVKQIKPRYALKKLELEQKLESINHKIDPFSEDINDFLGISKDKLNDINQIEYPSADSDDFK